MQLRLEQLEAHLSKSLAPVYTVHGDEPLLALEAADALRGAARSRGFAEREVFEPGRSFDWSEFTHATASMSLFAGKKLVELRLPGGKPGTQGAAALADYLARPGPDVLLLVSLPRLDRAGQRSDWFGALSAAGGVVDIYPVERARLPAWIAARLARQKQSAAAEVLEFLAERVEGNLLAAHQEVQKLALLAPPGELALDTVQQAVASVARYDPYAAAEALVSRELARYVRVIEGLRGEGEQPTFVLFVISAALFVLQGLQRGAAADPLFVQHRLFNKPLQRAVQTAAKGFPAAVLERALSQAAAIDRAIKGVGNGDPWQGFIILGLKLADGSKA
jgi:DNA polymerase-3 subunit delta